MRRVFQTCFMVTCMLAAGLGWAERTFPLPAQGALCEAKVAACKATKQAFPASGQTRCWDASGAEISCADTGQDGDVQAGAELSYTDEGETITDNNTKLRWEKKDYNNAGGIHDKNNVYSWTASFDFIRKLNNTCNGEGLVFCATDDECGTGGTCGFAGFQDWRLPNVKELQTILNYEVFPPAPGPNPPMVSAAFNSACVPGCTTADCSCTVNFEDPAGTNRYWSSTTFPSSIAAYSVDFQAGIITDSDKASELRVRAVRGPVAKKKDIVR